MKENNLKKNILLGLTGIILGACTNQTTNQPLEYLTNIKKDECQYMENNERFCYDGLVDDEHYRFTIEDRFGLTFRNTQHIDDKVVFYYDIYQMDHKVKEIDANEIVLAYQGKKYIE